ncbi:MAG: hypothetical protein AB8E15_01495 [Bdellovibrionales bacterium]
MKSIINSEKLNLLMIADRATELFKSQKIQSVSDLCKHGVCPAILLCCKR